MSYFIYFVEFASERQPQIQTSLAVTTEKLRIPDQATLDKWLEARLGLPVSRRLMDEQFELSIVRQCWETQLKLKGKCTNTP